jgi:hypothetical protein
MCFRPLLNRRTYQGLASFGVTIPPVETAGVRDLVRTIIVDSTVTMLKLKWYR